MVLLPVAVAREGVPTLSYAPATWAALFYLACIASALAYFLFYAILKRTGAGNLGFATLLLVPFAILFGVIFFGESLSPQAYLGFGLLALGMAVLDGRVLAKFS